MEKGTKITKDSGQQDVWEWINQYLAKEHERPLTEDHPIVEALFKWVKAQYAKGRSERISDEEVYSALMMIRSLPGLEIGSAEDSDADDDEDDTFVDVAIIQTSGRLGVWWWVNRYMELSGQPPISETNSAIDAIYRWVDAEYTAGRETPISDMEMLAQMTTHLNEEA